MNLKELPVSVVVHGILSSIDAGVHAPADLCKIAIQQPNVRPGVTMIRGLFSNISIGQPLQPPKHTTHFNNKNVKNSK